MLAFILNVKIKFYYKNYSKIIKYITDYIYDTN
jgi:hypothetical protein